MSEKGGIVFDNVCKTFPGQSEEPQVVLDHVSFTIPEGMTTVIAGGSGQGKSVTLKIILGLMRVDSGRVLVHGDDVTVARGRALEKIRTGFGVLFQGAALFDSLSVYENIALPLRERTGKSEEEIRAHVDKALVQFELAGHEQKYPAQLSGGMRKRVGLARAMQLRPSIMLFDEPTTGLDPVMTQEIYDLFRSTQKKYGLTSVIVSHDIPKVFELADQILILQKGVIDAFDSVQEILDSPKEHIREIVEKTMKK